MSDVAAHRWDASQSALPAWSLPRDAVDRIALPVEWPERVTRDWALGGSTGKGVRVCILDSGVDASHPRVGELESSVFITLGDDDFTSVSLAPFGFTLPFYTQTYSSVWVNANGSLTFNNGSGSFQSNSSEMIQNEPRIAGFWSDLNPSLGGTIQFVIDQRSSGSDCRRSPSTTSTTN